MATIFYFHGFGSTPNSSKITTLKESFPEHDVIAPPVPVDPTETVQMVVEMVRSLSNFPAVFVGTSLGGFWAHHFSQAFDAPGVLINPSITPSETMKERIGKELYNFDTNEQMPAITEDMVSVYKEIETFTNENYNGALVHLFGAEDDDVLDISKTINELKYVNYQYIFEDGGHRFTDHFGAVVTHISHLLGSYS